MLCGKERINDWLDTSKGESLEDVTGTQSKEMGEAPSAGEATTKDLLHIFRILMRCKQDALPAHKSNQDRCGLEQQFSTLQMLGCICELLQGERLGNVIPLFFQTLDVSLPTTRLKARSPIFSHKL